MTNKALTHLETKGLVKLTLKKIQSDIFQIAL